MVRPMFDYDSRHRRFVFLVPPTTTARATMWTWDADTDVWTPLPATDVAPAEARNITSRSFVYVPDHNVFVYLEGVSCPLKGRGGETKTWLYRYATSSEPTPVPPPPEPTPTPPAESDLTVTAVSDPPATLVPGVDFKIRDTTRNDGPPVPATVTAYYLSLVPVMDDSALPLARTREVPPLPRGGTSTVAIRTALAPGTPAGAYFLIACADATGVLPKPAPTSCKASETSVQVGIPDLIVTAIESTVAQVRLGGSLPVTETVKNQGSGTSAVNAVRYCLSTDAFSNGSDWRLPEARIVAALAPNTTSRGTTTVSVPTSTPPGTYFVLACADDPKNVIEASDANNCRASATMVTVTP
jgi:hypothetical protein